MIQTMMDTGVHYYYPSEFYLNNDSNQEVAHRDEIDDNAISNWTRYELRYNFSKSGNSSSSEPFWIADNGNSISSKRFFTKLVNDNGAYLYVCELAKECAEATRAVH